MCLITKKKNVSIAKRDKTVFKAIRRHIIDNHPNLWTGPFYKKVYFPFNEVVTARDFYGREIDHLQLLEGDGYYYPIGSDRYIEEGIHSCRVYLLSLIYLDCYSKICVIPEGSEYCCGKDGEVVSTKIIVFSSYKEYFKYRWKKLLEKTS